MKIKKKQYRILYICPLPYIGSMTFVMESIHLFQTENFKIDLLVSDNCDPPLNIDTKDINIYYYKDKGSMRGAKYFYSLIESICLVRSRTYDLIIGISQIGLIISSLLKMIRRVPIIFFNDEIWFGNERRHYYENIIGYMIKALEVIANQNAILTVTQDCTRGYYLSKVNKINERKIRYLPNSQPGLAKISKSTYLHDLLGIKKNRLVILWMGAVSPGDGALELAQMVSRLPTKFVLVFHFRSENHSAYMKNIIDCFSSFIVSI